MGVINYKNSYKECNKLKSITGVFNRNPTDLRDRLSFKFNSIPYSDTHNNK